jgi:pyrimidine-nucleoside phosphorylase
MMHAVDLIRKTRDGVALSAEELHFLVAGAAGTEGAFISQAQLAAWLMAAYQRGITLEELSALTGAMRTSGETFDARDLGTTVDKHSTGGVGDKTSLLVAPIAAAAGLYDPMISGRGLGHTGGTLDKLEAIPGFRTDLSLGQMRSVLERTGACLVGQTTSLVPADRTLYALRDHTGTVESPYLICASIMSKKLAAGLNALVLDVKTGSGAFLRDPEQARFLAELMVETGERAGTRTAALLTDMSQPLGEYAGNWIEVAECCALLHGERPALSEDLRTLSLELAAWMLHLAGAAADMPKGRRRAEALIADGSAWKRFRAVVEAQGGDVHTIEHYEEQHAPGAETVLRSPRSGYVTAMDTTAVGWAVQRLGAGRARVGDPVDAHAGLRMHIKLGAQVQAGEALATLYAAKDSLFQEPLALLANAITVADEPGQQPPLLGPVILAKTLQQKT